ncbi:MAG: ChbG/HpnK family deacetylase [Candidatus Magnetoovum sp. WYHC-5]|nr:ChbG/HpnK family deacetylase [Candidatus Magnetoovum sp. WYHC-5]
MSVSLIVTADDFGRSVAINRAVEIAATGGILRCTSLMVNGLAISDALLRLEKLSDKLQVGLHITLTEGKPLLNKTASSFLVNKHGNFIGSQVGAGLCVQFNHTVRKQVEKEVAAQFKAYKDIGLFSTHVDSHHHMHIHPVIFDILLENAAKYGFKRIRIPTEPWEISPICKGHKIRNFFYRHTFTTLGQVCRKKLSKTNIKAPDGVFGLYITGELTADWLLMLIELIKSKTGTYELYTHPADTAGTNGYSEFMALLDQRVHNKILNNGITLMT